VTSAPVASDPQPPAASVDPIRWRGDHLELLDQRALPAREIYLRCDSAAAVAAAIRDMVVRGAPAIGISAAYGMALAARTDADLHVALTLLASSRPTAVNLFWALAQCRAVIDRDAADPAIAATLLALAQRLHRDDLAINRRIGDVGAALIEPGSTVYTHCNAGALATGGYGTALGVIRSAFRDGNIARVFAGETRPWWQGARLTSWELMREHIPVTVCTEGAASLIMARENVRWVIVGADRVAANGDVANKIGTYTLAVLAKHHGVRVMACVPTSTFDLTIATGADIPIEERAASEITEVHGEPLAPIGCPAFNPAFDVTPAALIDAIVTEFGVIHQPNRERIAAHFAAMASAAETGERSAP
jgi:methylthioribose-1-phosphate isomerase